MLIAQLKRMERILTPLAEAVASIENGAGIGDLDIPSLCFEARAVLASTADTDLLTELHEARAFRDRMYNLFDIAISGPSISAAERWAYLEAVLEHVAALVHQKEPSC